MLVKRFIYIVTFCALFFIVFDGYSQDVKVVSGGIKSSASTIDTTIVTIEKAPQLQSPIFRDTMSISKVTARSLFIPGFAQLYNKQYWKIPALYATTGTFAFLTVNAGNKYRNYKSQYDALRFDGVSTRDQIDPVQTRMIQYRNQRNVFLMGAIFSYIYFIGDGAINYPNHATTVKKATTLSMIFPGAGQAYNKSYWKLPIVVGAFASMGYIIDFNSRGYKRFKEAANVYPNDEFKGRYPQASLQNIRDQYRRNRDLSIIFTGALYILNVIEAHVDAYMKDFDVSDDLSVRVEPTMIDMSKFYAKSNTGLPGFGLALKMNF